MIAWSDANQRFLVAMMSAVGDALDRQAAARAGRAAGSIDRRAEIEAARAIVPGRTALDVLADALGLSAFEQDLLVLCAAVELDGSFAVRCADAAGDERRRWPTFALALTALPGAHWSAIAATGPLRRFSLVELDAGEGIAAGRLRIDERVLHFLVGIPTFEPRLAAMMDRVEPTELVASAAERAERVAALLRRPPAGERLPAVQLTGASRAPKAAIAASAASVIGLGLYQLRAGDLPQSTLERDLVARLWEREAVLSGAALLVSFDDESAEATRAALAFVERVGGVVLVDTREPIVGKRRRALRVDCALPSADEQAALWQQLLEPAGDALNGELRQLVTQFSLSTADIENAAAEVTASVREGATTPLPAMVWDACRREARPRLDDLAQRIEAGAGWDDLVLPPLQMRLLRDIAAHVRQRARVYEEWGFAGKGPRGLGITALFAGVSGTGKTMAAEVLARELALDLYRIDLSQVVSKYIGETEKNLRRIFDAAEIGGAILLFDEADALFGKRSEVKDSHDRYANLEVSYLLQRMEAYRGLAVLTTNQRNALDPAFLRRLRFVVEFPFPDAAERAEIWRRVFPTATPRVALDYARLARLNVSGGVIRCIALNAAFVAADAGQAVSMAHLRRAAEAEYGKLEKPLTEHELGGWT